MNEIKISFLKPPKGYAKLNKKTKIMTIFLPHLKDLLNIPKEYFPFNSIEEIIEELIIHETLHEITQIEEDKIIDSWHMLLCKSESGLNCKCPIDCFYRDVMC